MSYEIELKFPLENREQILAALDQLSARPMAELEQCDRYFAHPSRDFGQTNEALRVRESGSKTCITYKGPVLDGATKTRREIELALADGERTAEQLAELLQLLGFTEVRAVRKTRQPYHLAWQDRDLEITVDHVKELGWYLEIETLADETDRPAAEAAILSLAEHLQLKNSERRAYLTLLIAKNHPTTH